MNKLAILILLTMLSACTTIETRNIRTEIPVVHPEEPEPLVMRQVNWQVWDHARILEEASKPENEGRLFYVLPSTDMQNYSRNLVDILEYTEITKVTKQFYRDLIERHNQAAREDRNR